MLKNILKTIFLSIFVLICTSCANVDYKLTINEDESASLEYLIKIEDAKINIDIYSGIIDVIIKELETNEFVVTREINKIKAIKEIENILDLDELDSLIKSNGDYIVRSDEGFFTTNYIFDAKIDLTGYSKTAKELKLDKELKELLDISFELNLPSEAKYSNSNVEEGKILAWDLEYGEENIIQVGYSLLNWWAIAAIVLIIVILVVILILLKIRKDKKQTIKF